MADRLSLALVSALLFPLGHQAEADGRYASGLFVIPYEVSCGRPALEEIQSYHGPRMTAYVDQLRAENASQASGVEVPRWLTEGVISDLKWFCEQPRPDQGRDYDVYNTIQTPTGNLHILDEDYVVPTIRLSVSHHPIGQRIIQHCDLTRMYNAEGRVCVVVH